jgi:hypothetical protein
MWLYPLPSMIAFLGWTYIFLTSGWRFAGFGMVTLIAGVVAYLIWISHKRSGTRQQLALKPAIPGVKPVSEPDH